MSKCYQLNMNVNNVNEIMYDKIASPFNSISLYLIPIEMLSSFFIIMRDNIHNARNPTLLKSLKICQLTSLYPSQKTCKRQSVPISVHHIGLTPMEV